MNKKQFNLITLKTKADSFNAGYGKIIQRVIFCKDAGKHTIQQYGFYNSNTKKEWFCLHD